MYWPFPARRRGSSRRRTDDPTNLLGALSVTVILGLLCWSRRSVCECNRSAKPASRPAAKYFAVPASLDRRSLGPASNSIQAWAAHNHRQPDGVGSGQPSHYQSCHPPLRGGTTSCRARRGQVGGRLSTEPAPVGGVEQPIRRFDGHVANESRRRWAVGARKGGSERRRLGRCIHPHSTTRLPSPSTRRWPPSAR